MTGSAGAGSSSTGSSSTGSSGTGKASTRELILDTAERLFAEQGIFATSNRRIAEAAGQGNNWVAGYHFGSKADLVRAITRRFTAEVERSRMQMLAALGDSAGLEELLGCLVRPWTDRFEALGPSSYFARVCAQAMNNPTLRPIVVEEGSHSDSVHQTWDSLDQYLPGRADLSTELRRDMIQHLIVFVCAEREGALAERRPVSRQTWADEADGLIDALQGIITAPMADLPPSPVRRRPYGRVT
ncbi:MAG: TetR/AcrR family transcriptional regulator [Trebonia sp.]